MTNPKTILGIDPGTQVTGYGVIVSDGSKHTLVDFGCIRPPRSKSLQERYLIIFKGVEHLLGKYQIEALSVETQYVKDNVQSALKLGRAQGVIQLAATLQQIPIFEYAPSKAKRAVCGNGQAGKDEVQKMVSRLLGIVGKDPPEDAADALALALCHAHLMRCLRFS